MNTSADQLLHVSDLTVDYPRGRSRPPLRAVDHVSFGLGVRETVSLVGESGSGKTTIGRAILGLAPITEGAISFSGEEITYASYGRRRALSAELQVVFQDPFSSLNPTRTIGQTLAETLRVHSRGSSRSEIAARVEAMLDHVGLPAEAVSRYPAHFSGGQRQRVAIARALIAEPRVVICDEPTSALDLSVQAQILNLLRALQDEFDLSYLFISHDLAVVRHLSHRIVVLYQGRIMEQGAASDVYLRPLHPYTQALIASAPVPDPLEQRRRRLTRARRDDATMPAGPSTACPFAPRCPHSIDICRSEQPPLEVSSHGAVVACHRWRELHGYASRTAGPPVTGAPLWHATSIPHARELPARPVGVGPDCRQARDAGGLATAAGVADAPGERGMSVQADVINGFVAPGFERVKEEFERNFVERGELGAAFVAVRDREPVVDLCGGIADSTTGERWRADTAVSIFSGTKGLVAICMLLLLERGQLDLEAPVARYWPEFAAAGKHSILVRDVVSHTARLPGLETRVRWQEATDAQRMAELLAAQPLNEDPRAGATYHALTYGWLCGELVRRIDGRSVGRFFADEVASPLNLDVWIGLPEACRRRVARVELGPAWASSTAFSAEQLQTDPLLRSIANPVRYEPDSFPWNEWKWQHAEVPGANAIGTARSIAELYGKLDCLLAPETLELACHPLSVRRDTLRGVPMAFGVGFALQTEELPLGPPTDAFGHGGAGGSLHGSWPKRRIGFSYAMNLMRNDVDDVRAKALLQALFESSERNA